MILYTTVDKVAQLSLKEATKSGESDFRPGDWLNKNLAGLSPVYEAHNVLFSFLQMDSDHKEEIKSSYHGACIVMTGAIPSNGALPAKLISVSHKYLYKFISR